MEDAPHDLLAIEDPTQPYEKQELERMQRKASAALAAAKSEPVRYLRVVEASEEESGGGGEEWVEVEGVRLWVSLDRFASIGDHGGHPAARSCRDGELVSGRLGASGRRGRGGGAAR
ncbi:MAG: hypothetical protein HC927_00870 [Deltaproteobacteria bacterium]|nr:hypothetical protein [Deltaproteobacteria bacterium]